MLSYSIKRMYRTLIRLPLLFFMFPYVITGGTEHNLCKLIWFRKFIQTVWDIFYYCQGNSLVL